ncbi:dihydrodipicolinate synthase family protein [Marinilabiliaceae bacterium ANBcel2]|nr:dihydrodipicolinate synthase family protein [Marinilabiliaceae bacterium ANBcel2]
MERIEGVIAAPFTPMDGEGEIVPDKIGDYFKYLERNGIVGVFINGSTGEGVSLSQDEKRVTTEAWVDAASGSDVKVIALVGGTSYKESIDNAVHARNSGVDAIALMAPYYFKPADALQLAQFCAKIGDVVNDIPLYFYHIPVLTGCNVAMFDFLKEASLSISNLAGIKYTHEDFMDFLSCKNFQNEKFNMMWGRDENMLSALVLGCRCAVGSTFNYAAPLYYKMIEQFDNGDFDKAQKLQQKSIDMIRLLGKYGGIATGKAYMRYLGFDFGGFRLPVKNMSEKEYISFCKDVDSLKMGDLFSK